MIRNQNETHKLSKVENGYKYAAYNEQILVTFPSENVSLSFSKIPDISLTAVKFPDISRFSRQVVTLDLLVLWTPTVHRTDVIDSVKNACCRMSPKHLLWVQRCRQSSEQVTHD